MPISSSCPRCGNSLCAPDRFADRQVKCLKCDNLFTLTPSDAAENDTEAESAAPPCPNPAEAKTQARKEPVTLPVRAAFWMGLASVTLGVGAVVTTRFRTTADHSELLAWLGILLGGGALVLSLIREECGFTFPFAGSAASLVALALISFWLGTARSPTEPEWRPPFGGPGGMSWPPSDSRGGPPRERGPGGPRPQTPP